MLKRIARGEPLFIDVADRLVVEYPGLHRSFPLIPALERVKRLVGREAARYHPRIIILVVDGATQQPCNQQTADGCLTKKDKADTPEKTMANC